MVAAAGPIDLLVANAGIALREDSAWETDLDEWWHVRGRTCSASTSAAARLPGMLERGGGRIVITGSGASYLPGATASAYSASKAAVGRYGETLANQVEGRRPGLRDQPRPRAHGDDGGQLRRTTRRGRRPSWRPASSLELASGRFDALSGRYIHAEHDPLDELERRIDRILAEDLNAIRLRRER